MITGQYEFRGAVLPAACIQSVNFQMTMVPEPRLWFDGIVWASVEAKEAQIGPLEMVPAVRMQGVASLPEIQALLAGQTKALLALGVDATWPDDALAGIQVGASIAAMDRHLLTLPQFQGWVRVP